MKIKASYSGKQTHKDKTFSQHPHTSTSRPLHANPSTGGYHIGASSTFLSSDSSPSCIMHVHAQGSVHSTLLCALMGSQHL